MPSRAEALTLPCSIGFNSEAIKPLLSQWNERINNLCEFPANDWRGREYFFPEGFNGQNRWNKVSIRRQNICGIVFLSVRLHDHVYRD